MLPFQAELYRAIFPHHIAQSRTVLISRADDIRPYSSNRANGFLQRGHGRFFRGPPYSMRDMAMAFIFTV